MQFPSHDRALKVSINTVWDKIKRLAKRKDAKLSFEEGKQNKLYLHQNYLETAIKLVLDSNVGMGKGRGKDINKRNEKKRITVKRTAPMTVKKKNQSEAKIEQNRIDLVNALMQCDTALYVCRDGNSFVIERFSDEKETVADE